MDKKQSDVADMFDDVAHRYDLMNFLLSLGRERAWRRATTAAIDPRPDERILDLAAGTGTSSRPLADAGAVVFPADLSAGMLAEGRRRQPDLHFIAADATDLPFADGVFDAATMSFGLRNVPDVPRCLAELRRVVRPGGRLVICEFAEPTLPGLKQAYRLYLRRIMPALAKISSNPVSYSYLRESILGWPSRQRLATMMGDAGWTGVQWRDLTGGIVALHRAVAG